MTTNKQRGNMVGRTVDFDTYDDRRLRGIVRGYHVINEFGDVAWIVETPLGTKYNVPLSKIVATHSLP